MEPYLPYIKYEEPTKRMPLFIKPEKKLSLLSVMDLMRDHQENTYFDNTKDIGAQAYHMPYRYRPLFWTHDGKSYLNERPTATQQSGWVFVAQPRGTLFEAPDRKSGIIWFGADEAGSTVFCPMYTCMTKISPYWQEADNDLMTFKFESAFWAFNLLANWAYPRYSLVYPEIKEKIDQYEEGYFKKVKQIDAQAKADPENAVQIYTDFSYEESHKLVDEWVDFWKFLFMKYLDGNRKYKVEGEKNPKVEFPGYPPEWYERIVDETGDHYKII